MLVVEFPTKCPTLVVEFPSRFPVEEVMFVNRVPVDVVWFSCYIGTVSWFVPSLLNVPNVFFQDQESVQSKFSPNIS